MDIYVLNQNLEAVGVVDTYMNIIWTTRYFTSGDFELQVSATAEMMSLLQKDRFLVRDKDISQDELHNVMIIKNIELVTDPENGNTLTVTGKSISAIIGQRVVASQTMAQGKLQDVLLLMLAENILYPSTAARQISNFEFDVEAGFADTVDFQVTGENLEDYFSAICEKYNYGWDVFIRSGKFVFYLYAGADRSANQTANPQITFSSQFDNIYNTDYQYLTDDFKNVAVVAGEGEGAAQKKEIVGTASGLNRYEVYVDAQSTSTNDGNVTDTNYTAMLTSAGNTALAEYINNQLFDGEVDVTTQYVLNRDFFLGDVVQISNDFGITGTARILEVIESEDASGSAIIPTFSAIQVS